MRSIEAATARVWRVQVGNTRKSYITKAAALRAYARLRIAEKLPCACSRGDAVTPGEYCGCIERRGRVYLKFIRVVRQLAKEPTNGQ